MLAPSFYDTDLSAPTFHANPHRVFSQMRVTSPIYWSDAWNAWVVTAYDDVMAVLRDTDNFSSAGRVRYLLKNLDEATRADLTRLENHYEIGLAHSDPPDHTRLRSLLNKVFTPRMVETWRGRIETVTHELIDEMLMQDEPDMMRDLAYPLPATIIAEMIGAAPDDIKLFREWAVDINRLFELGGRISAEAAKNAQASLSTMRDYILQLVADRQQSPRDDIVGRLVSAEEKLSTDELVSTCVTLFVAGHETTTTLISNGMYLLLTHPEQLQILQENPDKIASAIEEILRYEPSVPRAWRIAKNDVTLHGQTIKAGSLIFPILSAANRDPKYFIQPDTFDILRQDNKQLAFGYGIHFCLGAPLARVEGTIAIAALLERLPNMQLRTTPQWRPDIAIRSLENLPIHIE